MAIVEYSGRRYDARPGGPFDRGMSDNYHGRPMKPHYWTGGVGNSTLVHKWGMSKEDIELYEDGYIYHEVFGSKLEPRFGSKKSPFKKDR